MALLVVVRVRRWPVARQLRLTLPASLVAGSTSLMVLAGQDLDAQVLGTPNLWVVLGLAAQPLVLEAADRGGRRLFGPEVTPPAASGP